VDYKTWLDLDKPKLQPTTRVLGAFEDQLIRPVGYFETKTLWDDATQCSTVLQIYVSQNGLDMHPGSWWLIKLNITINPNWDTDSGNYELETQDTVCLLEQQSNVLPIKAVDIQ